MTSSEFYVGLYVKIKKNSKCWFNVCFSALEDFGLSPRVVDIGEMLCLDIKPFFMSLLNSAQRHKKYFLAWNAEFYSQWTLNVEPILNQYGDHSFFHAIVFMSLMPLWNGNIFMATRHSDSVMQTNPHPLTAHEPHDLSIG